MQLLGDHPRYIRFLLAIRLTPKTHLPIGLVSYNAKLDI